MSIIRHIDANSLEDFYSIAGESRRIWLKFGTGMDAFAHRTNSTAEESVQLAENLMRLGFPEKVGIFHQSLGFQTSYTLREKLDE